MAGIDSTTWIDVSVPIRSGMVHWPGDPSVAIERVTDLARGDAATTSKITMGAHSGTHMDAPCHFIQGGESIDMLPFDATIGHARVVEIQDFHSIRCEELESCGLQAGEKILFKTHNSQRCWNSFGFCEDFVFITEEAARFIAERGVKVVGVDYLSVGGFKADGAAIHRILLQAGVWIIEGLNLAPVREGDYEVICLPIRIEGADGAPARVIVRPVPSAPR